MPPCHPGLSGCRSQSSFITRVSLEIQIATDPKSAHVTFLAQRAGSSTGLQDAGVPSPSVYCTLSSLVWLSYLLVGGIPGLFPSLPMCSRGKR